jgi:chemotaxis protein methyltransferase CheR
LPESERAGWCARLISAHADAPLWRDFVEGLLVHETYFFRHPTQLQHLTEDILPDLIAESISSGRRSFTAWCPGCSTGEEVYTLALMLRAAIQRSAAPDLSAWRAMILGTDLSDEVLETARRGVYAKTLGLNSFRALPDFAKQYFPDVVSGMATSWSPDDGLRSLTRFARHNLAGETAPAWDADLVLCRNTLIYFDAAQTRATIDLLKGALRPSGVLMLGPSDIVKDLTGFGQVAVDRALYWRKEARAA